MPKTLKELLGEDLYDQVKERIGNAEITVVDPDNPTVPKRRLDEVILERNRYKDLAAEHENQLNDLKVGLKDNDSLKAQIADLQAKNKQATEEYGAHLKEQRFAFAVERAVANAEARNVKAVTALLDKTKISLDGENLLGFDAQVAALRESDPYLFGVELKGRAPEGAGKSPLGTENPWKKETWNLTKQGEITKKDPDLAAKLRAQAGAR